MPDRLTSLRDRLGRPASEVPVRVHGVALRVRRGTPDLGIARESLGAELDVPISHLPADFDGLAVDAGGYIGTAAVKLARAFPKATVVTIEASERNSGLLSRNVAAVGNIRPLRAALGAEPGLIELRDRGTGECGFTIVADPGDAPGATALGLVERVTPTQVMDRFGAAEIGLLKLDIEGAEHDLLDEAATWLPRVRVLVAELHDRIVPGTDALFAEATRGRLNVPLSGEKHLSVREAEAPRP